MSAGDGIELELTNMSKSHASGVAPVRIWARVSRGSGTVKLD